MTDEQMQRRIANALKKIVPNGYAVVYSVCRPIDDERSSAVYGWSGCASPAAAAHIFRITADIIERAKQ